MQVIVNSMVPHGPSSHANFSSALLNRQGTNPKYPILVPITWHTYFNTGPITGSTYCDSISSFFLALAHPRQVFSATRSAHHRDRDTTACLPKFLEQATLNDSMFSVHFFFISEGSIGLLDNLSASAFTFTIPHCSPVEMSYVCCKILLGIWHILGNNIIVL